MKEKNLIDDNQSAQIAEDIKIVAVTFRKRKASLVEKIESLPIHLKEAAHLSDYLLETKVKYERLMDMMSDYENSTNPSKRDPFIQWIINNKRYLAKESFMRLTPKLTELQQLLKNHQSIVPNQELRKTSELLTKQYEQLNKEIIEITQSIELRFEEIKQLSEEHSALNELINTVSKKEQILFANYDEIVIDKESNRLKNNTIVIALVKKMSVLISEVAKDSDCILSFEVLNNLNPDDRKTILNVSRQGITLMNVTKSQLRKNTHSIMLEEERLEKRERIILDSHDKLIELYNNIKHIILEQPFKSLSNALNSEKKTYDECITLVSKNAGNHLRSSSREQYANYLLDFSTIQSKLHKKIARFAPHKVSTSEQQAITQVKITQTIVNNQVQIALDTDDVTDIIKQIQETKIKAEGDLKTKAYQEVISALKEANALFIPFLAREEKYIASNEQLNQLKIEINTLIRQVEESPIYSKQIFYSKKKINSFIDANNKINYSDCESMDNALEERKVERDSLARMLNQSIAKVTTRYVQRINALENRLEMQLNALEGELESYRPSLRGRLNKLKQLNRPANNESTLFFDSEIITFEHCKNIIDVELDALENARRELASAESERRTQSKEVQFILHFIETIFLDENPLVIIQLQAGLQVAMNNYIERKTNKEEFYAAINNTIQNTLLTPENLKQITFYDTKPFKHFIKICLQLVNAFLEFFAQALKDDNKPTFFSIIPKEITKCELALTVEKARVVLLELSNTNEMREMPRFNQ